MLQDSTTIDACLLHDSPTNDTYFLHDQQLGRYSKTRYIASFVGFAPASEPLVTVLVVVEQPRTSYYGGKVAAPIFKEIVQRTLLFEDVLPFPEESNSNRSANSLTVNR